MGNGLIAFAVAFGVGGWVYLKTSRRSGGNAKSSLTGALVVGIFAFIVILTLLGVLDRFLQK